MEPDGPGREKRGTVLVTDEGFEPLTTTGEWPTRTVTAIGTDIELERPEILQR